MEIFYFLKQFISHYGYYALCLGLLIEGEVILVTAGILAQQQQLSLTWVITCAFVMTIARDQCSFTLGRFIGNKLFLKYPHLEKRSQNLLQNMSLYKHSLAFIYQFTLGLRYLAPFCFGVSAMKRSYFLCLNILNALAWTLLFSFLGSYLGASILPFMDAIKDSGSYLATGLLLLLCAIIFYHWAAPSKKSN